MILARDTGTGVHPLLSLVRTHSVDMIILVRPYSCTVFPITRTIAYLFIEIL
jgi:hypothetical protein